MRPARAPAQPAGARQVIGLAMLAAAVAQSFGRFTYAVLLPAIEGDVLGSYALAGALGTINMAAYLVGTVLVSVGAGRVEPATMVKVGLVGSVSGLALCTVAPGFGVLAVGLTLTGVAAAAIWIPAPGLAGASMPPERRGLAIGLVGSGIGLGIVFASQLNTAVRAFDLGDWRTVWAVEAAIGAVALVACTRWLHPPPVTGSQSGLQVGALRAVPGWAALTLAYAAYGLAYSLFSSYLVAALEDDAGFSPAHASAVYGAMGVAIIFGGIVLGRLSDRTGRRPTLVGGFVAMAGCALLVLAGREPWAALAAGAFGLVMSGLPAVIAAHLADHLHPRAFNAAFGVITLAFGVLQVIGPQLGGWLAEHTGDFTAAFLVSAGGAAIGAAASAAMPRPS